MPRNIERDKREADRRKNQLIEAGFRLFSQNGIETVSLQKVADAANVSPATMYKYFLTKEKLLIAISAKVWDEVWQEALGDPGTNHFEHFTAYQGIEFYADRMIALYKNRPEVLRFSGEYTVESDTSEADLFDEEAATMRQLYNAAEADFEGDSSLDIGTGSNTGGAGTGTVISGSIKQMIDQFYANHSDDLFECPVSGLLPGPWSGWKAKVTSSWQSPRGDTKHNGTDIAPPHATYPLVAPYKGIIVGKQDGYANGVLIPKGQGQRGNMLMIYYGERGGVVPGEKNGVFMLYQHMAPGLSYNVDDTIEAGAIIGYTGYSGYCISKTGTGEHLHLELYYGETQKDPEIEMSN